MELCRLHKWKGTLRYVSISFLRDIGMETWENGKPIFNGYILIIWEVIRVQLSNKYNRESSGFFSRIRDQELQRETNLQKNRTTCL